MYIFQGNTKDFSNKWQLFTKAEIKTDHIDGTVYESSVNGYHAQGLMKTVIERDG